MSFRVKKNDNVVVISGQEKGKTGRVISVDTQNDYVRIENLNMVSRHKKARNAQDKAGILKMEGNIHISNVMLLCSECNDAVRIKAEIRDGVKKRVCRKCGALLETKTDKKTEKAKRKTTSEKTEKASTDSRIKRTRKTAGAETAPVETTAAEKTVKRTKKSAEKEG